MCWLTQTIQPYRHAYADKCRNCVSSSRHQRMWCNGLTSLLRQQGILLLAQQAGKNLLYFACISFVFVDSATTDSTLRLSRSNTTNVFGRARCSAPGLRMRVGPV